MELGKALLFIQKNGSEVEQARLHYVLSGERPSREITARLFAGQRADGGWQPFWAEEYSSLDATCFRLAQAEQMGISGEEAAVSGAVDFLARRQSADGSWEEDQSAASFAPPWAKPGDLSARLYLTANCGLWLALFGNSEPGAGKAAGYLQAYLDEDGHLPGFMHTHWLAAGLWHRLNRQEPAERVFGYLSRRINDLALSNLAWLITTVCAAGVKPEHPLIHNAASILEQSQQEDGRWPSEDGAEQDVHATVEALRALRLCGRI